MVRLLLLVCGWAMGQERPELFAPADESVVMVGKVRVVGRAAGPVSLLLDGKAVAVASPGPGAVMAELLPGAGEHVLVLKGQGGESKVRFFVGEERAEWKMFRPHPPLASGCDTCHAVKNDAWALKRASLSPLCHTCHDKERFPAVHTHSTDILADCQNCHLPHGSTARGHMMKPKEVACKQCHS